jgi:hypothetical protein
MAASLAALLAVGQGCGITDRDGGLFGEGGPGADENAPGTGADDGEDGDGGDDGGDDGSPDDGVKFDTNDGAGGPGDEEEGCKKVDFLFVIDNSSSMGTSQRNLVTSFPGFISTIQDTLNAQDYHIMVVDTDEWNGDPYPYGGVNGADLVCEPHPSCCLSTCRPGTGTTCNGGPCPQPWPDPPHACDAVLGAARNINHYIDPCPIEGGKRYIVDGQPNLVETFECMAWVGLAGYWFERPMRAMVEAISEPLNAPGACNDGFLRDDALLVVTIISDAIPQTAPEMAEDGAELWYDAVVAAKHGDPEAVVVLGLFGDGDQPNGLCGQTTYGPEYFRFVELFGDNGVSASVCEPDYSPFFEQAVADIDAACDEYVPPQG